MYNQDVDRYIVRALYKTFDNNKGDLYMYLENDLDARDTSKSWIELRYDGPDVKLIKNNNLYTLDVDVFINCPVKEELYLLETMKGKVKSMFTCLYVYDDNSNLLFTMDTNELKTVDFGSIDESRIASTVRATYSS